MEKFISYLYVLDEYLDEMGKAKFNIEKVIKETRKLVDVLKKSEDKDFDALIRESENTIKNYEEQLKVFDYRTKVFGELLAKLHNENDEKSIFIISQLCESLGIANREGKSMEERIKNGEKPFDDSFTDSDKAA